MNSSDDPYVLLIEDNPADIRVIERLFEDLDNSVLLKTLNTGTDANEFLFSELPENRPLPALVLLDLNLPGTDGRKILDRMKSDERLKQVPVVVFTTSNSKDDRTYCYEAGSNSYVIKPSDSDQYRQFLTMIKKYWMDVVTTPLAKNGG